MKKKLLQYADALIRGDIKTRRYLYGILILTLLGLFLLGVAFVRQSPYAGLFSFFCGVTAILWGQSVTLTEKELPKEGERTVLSRRKGEKGTGERAEENLFGRTHPLRLAEDEETPYTVTEEQVRYLLKKSRVKKDRKEVMIDSCPSLGLKESPAYLWKNRKKFFLLVIGDGSPLKFEFSLSDRLILEHKGGVRCYPDKEYLRFRKPTFLSFVFSPFLPDYHEKRENNQTSSYKNLYRLGKDLYFTNTSAKNVFDLLGADFKVSDEVTGEETYGEEIGNAYRANLLWRDGVISAKEYKRRITTLLGALAKADIRFDDFSRTLKKMYEYNLITKDYVEFYVRYRKKMKEKR